MQVSREQFMEQGYLVLREVIPPERLEQVRADFETLVGRQRKIWAQERGPDDPPGGVWETNPQPRLVSYDKLIDDTTASTVEVWLQESTLGVSRQLLSVPEAASVAGMMLMCSPVRDHGPAAWHRDIHPIDMAPLAGLQKDLRENGPKYVQWNIPLYDDDVLWVVPGSHLRLNTEDENRSLSADPRRTVPGGIPVELNAGDAVVYINYLLHWGSNYSPKTRRTIHGGHTIFPYYPDISFAEFLSPGGRASFRQWDGKSAALQDLTEIALREALNGNADAYFDALEALQPGVGEGGKMVLTIYLSKAVLHLQVVKHENGDSEAGSDALKGITEDYRQRARSSHSISINWGPLFADRFTEDEAAALHRRFAILDDKLQAEGEHFAPGFQARPMRYFFNEMPADFTLGDFIGS
ncbi:MAG: phytanoyl-CoA dioxygenase family protein [Caldilineaceae bacterium]|nr:phytanoyl-CoA dioxygenase family protein [Caldilineaceae bacterium]